MFANELKNTDFFTALANLFYAVATADKVLKLTEKHRIFDEINNYWIYDVDGESSAEIMYQILRKNIAENQSSENAFLQFENYYLANKDLFTLETKKLIFDSTTSIASSYAQKNKSELVLLSQLQLLMAK